MFTREYQPSPQGGFRPKPAPGPLDRSAPRTMTRRILIIDDEEDIRALVQHMLNREGYETASAAEGREGLRLQRQAPADLIITDLMMPGQEGLETIMEIRRLFPHTKIIAMSGGGQGGVLDFLPIATQLGAARTMAKPFTHEQLITTVREVLGS
jgi:DNA-binding NtrC family response regulator